MLATQALYVFMNYKIDTEYSVKVLKCRVSQAYIFGGARVGDRTF